MIGSGHKVTFTPGINGHNPQKEKKNIKNCPTLSPLRYYIHTKMTGKKKQFLIAASRGHRDKIVTMIGLLWGQGQPQRDLYFSPLVYVS